MLEIPGFKNLKKIHWKDLDPGMVVIGGIKVNNGLPLELVNYPVLTMTLIHDLTNKYHFLPNKEVIVAEVNRGESPSRMSTGFRTIEKRIKQFNDFRDFILKEKEKIQEKKGILLPSNSPLVETPFINKNYLIKDTYNSFKIEVPHQNIPSMISHLSEKITLADILTGRLKQKFHLPEDVDITLHLVVDYSYSMNTMDKLDLVISAVNLFYTHISECMLNVKLQLYVFSDTCIPAKFPLSGKEIERRGTQYGSFMKKVLRHRNMDTINKVILFTDGEPTDKVEAITTGIKMKNLKIDYTQIIFDINEDRRIEYRNLSGKEKILDGFLAGHSQGLTEVKLSETEWSIRKIEIYKKFTEVAEACGGNQIIISIYELMSLIAVEVYDHYMGLLTLSRKPEIAPTVPEKNPSPKSKPPKDESKEKTIKPFQFKKIERPK